MEIQETENTPEHQKSVVINAPEYKLYSVQAVAIATFFGTALAGGYLMAKNYQRLGNPSYARLALLYTLLVVIASFVLGFVIPEGIPSIVVTLPVLLAMIQATKQLQGATLEQHRQNNGQFESCWKAWGISLLILVIVTLIAGLGIGIFDPDVMSTL